MKLIVAGLALVAVACWGSGCGGSSAEATYLSRVAAVLREAKTAHDAVPPPALNSDNTLDAAEQASIEERLRAVADTVSTAIGGLTALKAPAPFASEQRDAIAALADERLQLLGVAGQPLDTPGSLTDALDQRVQPARNRFKAACQRLQVEATTRNVDVTMECDL